MNKINLDNGKYTIVEDLNNGVFKALRYGEEWRNLTGDNLVLALFYKIDELQEQHREDEEIISKMAKRIKEFEQRSFK